MEALGFVADHSFAAGCWICLAGRDDALPSERQCQTHSDGLGHTLDAVLDRNGLRNCAVVGPVAITDCDMGRVLFGGSCLLHSCNRNIGKLGLSAPLAKSSTARVQMAVVAWNVRCISGGCGIALLDRRHYEKREHAAFALD